ncbi:MAG: glycoside hydrolase family 1 protein [Erysipelotrichaceae bacterium]|nr:glycoside hydrolase family 1 protein [Erysipelotrichaceae bacterium]
MIDVFQYEDTKFPKGFKWGVTTAAMQVEGGNHSFYDYEETAPKFAYGGLPYKMANKAANSYELYEEDIKLIKTMNLNSYRLSIEWSRIEPNEGEFNIDETNYYINLLKRLKEENISVVLTLHHFSHPVWFEKKKAFKTMDNIDAWERFLNYIVPKIEEYVDYWIVINELNLAFKFDSAERVNMLQYHAKGYHLIKKYSNKPVSSSLSYSIKEPLRGQNDYPDKVFADYIDFVENEFFIHAIKTGEIVMPFMDAVVMPELKDTCDFWSLNTYVRHLINSRKKDYMFDQYQATKFKAIDIPFFTEEITPEIMFKMLMRFNDRPIMITENGIAVKDDRIREIYIASMLKAMGQAIDYGVNVIGYMHFSLIDNWEWGINEPIFGLASFDPETFERTLKPSGYFYGDIAKENALTQEIIRKHLKELPSIINYEK